MSWSIISCLSQSYWFKQKFNGKNEIWFDVEKNIQLLLSVTAFEILRYKI